MHGSSNSFDYVKSSINFLLLSVLSLESFSNIYVHCFTLLFFNPFTTKNSDFLIHFQASLL